MTPKRVYIAGAGIVSPLGRGLSKTERALRDNRSAIGPLNVFPLLAGKSLPVGQVLEPLSGSDELPRTHRLALTAALDAVKGKDFSLDAIIIGTTTGGILTTEKLLRDQVTDKQCYRYHGLHTVAQYLADELGCTGPVLTVSTACSSGAAALALAMAMLRRGEVKTVLAGGMDSLCRLTYFGFHSLQLVDRQGSRPLDRDRQGMTVSEGAAMLLLTTEMGHQSQAELLGAGLSCDAYHPAAPHPEGRGALLAMDNALKDAGLSPGQIDYINFHGTGTLENDLAEAKAVNTLFAGGPPPLSSIKGATGHSLAAAGAIEATVGVIAVSRGLIPANTGLQNPDPALGLRPLTAPENSPVKAVLSNSFGFGGNNGCLVITRAEAFPCPEPHFSSAELAVHGSACLTGAGGSTATMAQLTKGCTVAGAVPGEVLSKQLTPQMVRRLKRLARMTLSLGLAVQENMGGAGKPDSIVVGTGWGALSETHDFLSRLAETDEQFPSPTDFVGSVHNGPAGQAAMLFGATGPNITVSGGDASFEEALLAADLLLADARRNILVLGVDEAHPVLSPLLDSSIAKAEGAADGGGALCLSRKRAGAICLVRLLYYGRNTGVDAIDRLRERFGKPTPENNYTLVLAGIPEAFRGEGESQLDRFLQLAGVRVPVVRYREYTGEFAAASAVAAVMAAEFLRNGKVPGGFTAGETVSFPDKGASILVLGFGPYISAMEFKRP